MSERIPKDPREVLGPFGAGAGKMEPNPIKPWNRRMFRGQAFIESADRIVNKETDSLRVQPVERMGLGLFAKKDIKVGERIFCAHGDEYYIYEDDEWQITDNIAKSPSPANALPNAICVDQVMEQSSGRKRNTWLNPDDDNPVRVLNHSCKPNVGRLGAFAFVAMHDIKQGEQIVADYAMLEVNPEWSMKCECSAGDDCRKDIGSVQTLTLDQADQYWKFIPTFMRKIYMESLKGKKRNADDRVVADRLASNLDDGLFQ